VYGAKQGYADYESGDLSAMNHCWNMYITQQCQQNHGKLMAINAEQTGNHKDHPLRMYTNANYWYGHYCDELRINSLLPKATAKGIMPMHICMSKIGMHCRNLEARTGPY
jgi:hypothetical protein